jgi:hypothetical protein
MYAIVHSHNLQAIHRYPWMPCVDSPNLHSEELDYEVLMIEQLTHDHPHMLHPSWISVELDGRYEKGTRFFLRGLRYEIVANLHGNHVMAALVDGVFYGFDEP